MTHHKPSVDPLLKLTLERIAHLTPGQIEAACGLSRSTIINWRKGRTRYPQAISLQFALRCVGMTLGVVPLKNR